MVKTGKQLTTGRRHRELIKEAIALFVQTELNCSTNYWKVSVLTPRGTMIHNNEQTRLQKLFYTKAKANHRIARSYQAKHPDENSCKKKQLLYLFRPS